MPRTIDLPTASRVARRVTPSIIDPAVAEPFTLEQELKPFGSWASDPIWVPPKDGRAEMAETMLRKTRPFTSKRARWDAVVQTHRSDFTQVREIDLFQPSIRLPKGKFYVTVTERADFDKIAEPIPGCVQTRLDEFLNGPGKKRGVKVYYLKPLCVEMDDQLILTTSEDLTAAITKIQDEVFAEYRRMALYRRPGRALAAAANLGLAGPRAAVNFFVQRRQRAIDAYQARLEFKRRKLALSVAETYRKVRTDGCSFDDALALTSPIKRTDVVDQYCIDFDLTPAQRDRLIRLAVGTIPWFLALSIYISSASTAMAMATPPLVMCDPAFVAEMPGAPGVVLKIGHFDEIAGVTHVEI